MARPITRKAAKSTASRNERVRPFKRTSSEGTKQGQEILKAEAAAIAGLAARLDRTFDKAVKLILEMPPEGRVVVSGIGKAGFIAMKISATLASTGTPSFFLHPAEALHGDLGRYSKGDIALLLSNSGETPEILKLVPHVKRIGCPILAVTGSPKSNLAKFSEVALIMGEMPEAGPFGLAPTTSTTAMLALGDALAMVILNERGFSREDFARFHPGGNIGRALMLISQIMRTGAEHCIVPATMLSREVLHRITNTKGRPGAASVIDASGKLIGIFTDGNLRRLLDQEIEFLRVPVAKVMSPNPKSVRQDQLVSEAARVLTEFKIDQVIVVNEQNEPVGMVDIQDVVELGF